MRLSGPVILRSLADAIGSLGCPRPDYGTIAPFGHALVMRPETAVPFGPITGIYHADGSVTLTVRPGPAPFASFVRGGDNGIATPRDFSTDRMPFGPTVSHRRPGSIGRTVPPAASMLAAYASDGIAPGRLVPREPIAIDHAFLASRSGR